MKIGAREIAQQKNILPCMQLTRDRPNSIPGSFAQFICKLSEMVQKQVKGKEVQEHLIKQFTFENVNENYQAILRPITVKDVMDSSKSA